MAMSTIQFDGVPEVPVRRKVSDEDREREAANERERRKLIEERRLKTYHGHAQHTDEDIYSGRYASVNTTVVTGAAPGSAFPQLPDGPWAKNELPDEPPLGLAIDEQEAVGEPHEIAASQSATLASDIGLHTGVVAAPPSPSEQEFRRHAPVDLAAGGCGRRRFARRA